MSSTWARRGAWLFFVGWIAVAVGCMKSPPPQFGLGLEGPPDVRQFPFEQRQEMVDILWAAFGDPDDPFMFQETGFDQQRLNLAAGPAWSDQEGVNHGLFRRHCVHCHGINGDGAGPTAAFLKPYPRDFRRGVFKYTSTGAGFKPTTDDLRRTIREGIPGTAMPSFNMLPEVEIAALAEYVKYLSIRGQVEETLVLDVEDGEPLPADRSELVSRVMMVVNTWNDAEKNVYVPDVAARGDLDTSELLAASIERGRELYKDAKKAQCINCHGPTGLGDGTQDGGEFYDDWNKDKQPDQIALWSLPKQQLQPRNLRLGVYRGGRRPVDIYRRIAVGIKGTPMPELGRALQPNEIWDLVNYVQALPYEEISEESDKEKYVVEARR